MENQSRPVTGYPAEPYPYPHPPPCNDRNGYSVSGTPAATATAYPYAAPPPQTAYYNPNPYYGQPYSPSPRRFTLRRGLFTFFVASLILAGTFLFIYWIVIRPRLPNLLVDSLTLSNFNTSTSSSVSGNWVARLTVRNPNDKVKLEYEEIQASIFYDSKFISTAAIAPFSQDTNNSTSFAVSFVASSAYVGDDIVKKLNDGRAGGKLIFTVYVEAKCRFRAMAWHWKRRYLRAVCKGLSVGIPANGTVGSWSGGSERCRVVV